MDTATGSVTLNPSDYTGQTSFTSTTISNGFNGTSNTTAASFTLSTSTAGYIYYKFDTSSIPSGATITSITGTAKVRVNNTSRVTNTICQLYTGTTAKGLNVTFASTSSSNTVTLSPGSSWTRSELNDLRLKIGATGSSSTSSKTVYFCGADVTINYSYTTYDITISNSSTATVTATKNTVPSGESTMIISDTVTGITVTDNSTDVTSQFAQHTGSTIAQTAGSFTTGYSASGISFYTSSSSSGNNFNYAVGHTAESPGTTISGDGSYTYVKSSGGSTTETGYADFVFDFSEIPTSATISSVQVKCYGAVESYSQSTSHADITLYSGSTQKGTMQKFTSSTNSIITLSDVGTWTATELQSAKLRFAVGYYGGHIFGITWTVVYQINGYVYTISNVASDHTIVVAPAGGGGQTIYYKNNGSWVAATAVYKKVNGSWVQQTNLSNVFDANTNYVKG